MPERARIVFDDSKIMVASTLRQARRALKPSEVDRAAALAGDRTSAGNFKAHLAAGVYGAANAFRLGYIRARAVGTFIPKGSVLSVQIRDSR